jgi:hypothetical protein
MQAAGGGPRGPLAVWSAELAKLWLYVDFTHMGAHSSLAVWTRYSQDGVDCRVRTPHSLDHMHTREGTVVLPPPPGARVWEGNGCGQGLKAFLTHCFAFQPHRTRVFATAATGGGA